MCIRDRRYIPYVVEPSLGVERSVLAVFMHYAEHEEKEKAIQLTYAEKAESYIETNYSYPITVEEIAS